MRQINQRIIGLPARGLSLADEISSGQMCPIWKLGLRDVSVEFLKGRDSAWLLIRVKDGPELALRTSYSFGGSLELDPLPNRRAGFVSYTPVGTYTVDIIFDRPGLVRCVQRLRPIENLLVSCWPRDLFVLGNDGLPTQAAGRVLASQRGLNAGIVFATVDHDSPGMFLYFQNLTALNEYFATTATLPDGRVGGVWPELGYEIQGNPTKPLPPGEELTISDALICVQKGADLNPRSQASTFIKMLADVYRQIDRPQTEFRNWPAKARDTLRDLKCAPEVTLQHYDHTFIRPYVNAEYPDSMSQLAVASPISEFQEWGGEKVEMASALAKGIDMFFDPKLKTLRRYLPNVGKDKNKDEVDSWYLYHPLSNLAWLAKRGDEKAKKLFFQSLEFGIKVARHFAYDWPIQYNLKTLEVIKRRSGPGQPGQSDVGGLYAYTLVQAWELQPDERYIEEASRAIEALAEYEFDLHYQANLVAFGAAACIRLYGITKRKFFRDQAKVFVASFLHNCYFWESEQAHAKNYSVWLGASCLHDSSYMAIYECSDSFVAFNQILSDPKADLDADTRLLMAEYCRYALSRAWSYYPAELPKSAIATEIRNGQIDRKLAFPLEDLYASGQLAGSVGQEVYGSGAAFLFSCRAFHLPEGAPFAVFCEYPLISLETEARIVKLTLGGTADVQARLRILPRKGHRIPKVDISFASGTTIKAARTKAGHREFFVPGDSSVVVRW